MKNLANKFKIYENKYIEPTEFANLMASVGWGREASYALDKVL